jgi:MerR family transcriptional regulator/heat shock protein HspR
MMDERDRALYIISVAAELAGVHAQTLRIYERKGLIEPRRTQGGSRRYSDRDITLLRRIQDLTNEGVSLAGVRRVLDLESELMDARQRIADLESYIEDLRREVHERIETVHRQYRRALVPVKQAAVRVRR